MEHEEFTEANKDKGITDDDLEPGCDPDGFPNAEIFNVIMAEGNTDGNPDDFVEDLFLDDFEDGCEAMGDTLPEMMEINHNIYIV